MSITEHHITIWFDDSYAARKWTAKCTCDWVASCRTEHEAKESAEIHRDVANSLDTKYHLMLQISTWTPNQ